MPCRKSALREKKTYGYRERDEAQRQEFMECVKEKDPRQIVYLDEAGIDNRSEYPYGYSLKGERVYAVKDGKRKERVSWLAALKEEKVFAPMTLRAPAIVCCWRCGLRTVYCLSYRSEIYW